MTSIRTLASAALCAVALVGAAVPASAEPFHGWGHPGWGHAGWGRPGWDHHWGYGRALAFGGLGLATGAVIASSYHPTVIAGPACGTTVSTHYNAAGELVKVVRQVPC